MLGSALAAAIGRRQVRRDGGPLIVRWQQRADDFAPAEPHGHLLREGLPKRAAARAVALADAGLRACHVSDDNVHAGNDRKEALGAVVMPPAAAVRQPDAAVVDLKEPSHDVGRHARNCRNSSNVHSHLLAGRAAR